ncbi:hypothetical protein VKT23_018264 [Stygiomarasmius scandens]|uniref:Uncharacterized protein n=1 Tax=Marasmiellus scandens TaxID=2682957 RepID=A0ABR1IPW2_9AGAR
MRVQIQYSQRGELRSQILTGPAFPPPSLTLRFLEYYVAHVNRRTVLKNAFNVSEIRDIIHLKPVSAERLALFNEDQVTFRPHNSEICLDTSAITAPAMRDCAWNRAVVEILAGWTDDLIDKTKSLSDRLSGRVDWAELFRCRFYDVFSDIQAAWELGLPDLRAQISARYDEKKDRNRRRRQLQQKFTTRQQICSIMLGHSQKIDKAEDVDFWTATLDAVNLLQADGMSDEETVHEGEEQVKVVKRVAFRHPDFTSLFCHVDSTPKGMKSLFDQRGRKPLRRVLSSESSQRLPPPDLPSTFYQPEYLDLMNKGLVPWVAVQENSTIPIPKVVHDKGTPTTIKPEHALREKLMCTPQPQTGSKSIYQQEKGHTAARDNFQVFRALVIEWMIVAIALYGLLPFLFSMPNL